MSLVMFKNSRFDPKVQKNDAFVETNILMLSRSAKKDESLSMHKDMTILKSLSQRGKYLLAAVAKGRSNKQIAYDLKLSEQTVKIYLSQIYRKIGASDRVEAAFFALQNGLIDECPQHISYKNNKNS
jgi:DNA-binding NarL/FixJ family response regulator